MIKILISGIALLVCTQAQAQLKYTLKLFGEIKNSPNGTGVYLVQKTTGDSVAFSKTESGKFNMTISSKDDADYYWLAIDTIVKRNVSEAIWIDTTSVFVSTDILKWPQVSVRGSSSHKLYELALKIEYEFRQKRDSLNMQKNAIRKAIDQNSESEATKTNKEKVAYIETEIKNNRKQQFQKISEFITDNSNSYFAPYIIMAYESVFDRNKLKTSYEGLSDKVKNSLYGVKLKAKLSAQILEVGNVVQDFVGMNQFKDTLQFSSLLKGNKYVLLDFWASWCKPCRQENPELKRVYNNFSSKGFNIISITADSKFEHWGQAIAKDSLTWIHLSDFEVKGTLPEQFKVKAFPSYYLLDKEGKVLYSDNPLQRTGGSLREGKLYEILEELLP